MKNRSQKIYNDHDDLPLSRTTLASVNYDDRVKRNIYIKWH